MGHSCIRAKVRRRKVAALAAKSRQFDVKNHMKKLAQSKDWKMIPFDTWLDKMPRFSYPKVAGLYYTIDKDGHVHFKDDSYESQKHKQPKRIMRYKKRKYTDNNNWTTNGVGGVMRAYDTKRHARNDFKTLFKNYPYNLQKMNRVEYMEKLVEHKTEKWERKNPQPLEMFAEEVERWKQERQTAIERIRDFVVSVYDKLILTGRYKINENKYREEKIAMVKDINGEGHHVNALPASSALIKRAQGLVNRAKARDKRLVAGNLRDHKKQKGRIILPQAA